MKATAVVTARPVPPSPRTRFRVAMILAMAADALQIFGFPLFAEGALSPADDVLDIAVAAVLVNLLGWHWEFLPAFLAELVPGVDLVPFWTMAVANVYLFTGHGNLFKSNEASSAGIDAVFSKTEPIEELLDKAKRLVKKGMAA